VKMLIPEENLFKQMPDMLPISIFNFIKSENS